MYDFKPSTTSAQFLAQRHGEKLNIAKRQFPGDVVDKTQVHIKQASGRKLQAFGKKFIVPGAETSIAYVSDFIRTWETINHVLQGANDKVIEKTQMKIKQNLGFGDGSDWKAEENPKFSDDPQELAEYVKTLFEDFYFPRQKLTENGKPYVAMAQYASAMVNALVEGIETLRDTPRKEGHGLLTITSHSPNVDTLGAILLPYINVDKKHKIVEVNDNYVGATMMSENSTGIITNLDKENPTLIARIKDKEVGYSLRELKKIQKNIAEDAITYRTV